MPTRPALVRSIPFWVLVAGSLATALAGGAILVDKLGVMTTTLTDGTATGVDVYVGQTVAVLGAILLGAGILGLLLAFAVATAASLRPVPAVEVVEPLEGVDDDLEVVDELPADESTAADAPTAPDATPESKDADELVRTR